MKPGSKEKLRHREKSRILREVYEKKTTISKIKNDLDLNVSRETIRRVITSSQTLVKKRLEENHNWVRSTNWRDQISPDPTIIGMKSGEISFGVMKRNRT